MVLVIGSFRKRLVRTNFCTQLAFNRFNSKSYKFRFHASLPEFFSPSLQRLIARKSSCSQPVAGF